MVSSSLFFPFGVLSRLLFITSMLTLSTVRAKGISQEGHECVQNDNFCDCGDDEPLTSACSSIMAAQPTFQCTDVEYVVMMLPGSRVHDRVCDCCDGSDEDSTTILCNNTCADIGAERAAREKEAHRVRTEGLSKKEKVVTESKINLQNLRQTTLVLQSQIKEKENLVATYEAHKKLAMENSASSQNECNMRCSSVDF